MEIHNYVVLSPLALHIVIATMMITTMMTTTMTIIMIMIMMTTTTMMMTTTTTWCMMIIVELRFWFSFLFWFKSITTKTIVKSNHNNDEQNRPFVNMLKNPKIFWQAINVMKHCDDSNCFIAKENLWSVTKVMYLNETTQFYQLFTYQRKKYFTILFGGAVVIIETLMVCFFNSKREVYITERLYS